MIHRILNKPVKALLYATFAFFMVCVMGMKSAEVDEWDRFINDDSEERALAVNEGTLEFLSNPPKKPPHELHNHFVINSQSLKDGWVSLIQCHESLDKVPDAQILYHTRRTRNLKILSSVGVEKAWVENNSVQLKNVTDKARVCISAEVHSLYPNFDGTFSMRNGPFLRRFLDGYYPMHVTMDMKLPEGKLSFGAITPVEQAGFSVDHDSKSIKVDALFVGELNVEVYLDGADG